MSLTGPFSDIKLAAAEFIIAMSYDTPGRGNYDAVFLQDKDGKWFTYFGPPASKPCRTEKELKAFLKKNCPEPKPEPFHCTHCNKDVSDVRCYSPGKDMTPEKCRGCPQLCQGMDYGEEWVGCHANPKHEYMIHG